MPSRYTRTEMQSMGGSCPKSRNGLAAKLGIETEVWRIPDRASGFFQEEGNRRRLRPAGRPSDLYADVLVTLAKIGGGHGRVSHRTVPEVSVEDVGGWDMHSLSL